MDKKLTLHNSQSSAINIASMHAALEKASHYIHAATSDNTRKAYQQDIRHFRQWGGFLPATTDHIIAYLQHHAESLNVRTLERRLVAIKQWHIAQNLPDPTSHLLVRKTLTGIKNIHGQPKKKARVLTLHDLITIVSHLKKRDELIDARNSTLLQIGFFGAFRRSELVNIQYEHLRFVSEGVEILIPRSKTDQSGEGKICAIPYGNDKLCPVNTLKNWCERAKISSGYIFRRLNKGGHMVDKSIAGQHVSILIKSLAQECHLPDIDLYSSHSLRRGFATTAGQQGVSLQAIMQQGRWQHTATALGYLEEGRRFEGNAAGLILKRKPYENEEMI